MTALPEIGRVFGHLFDHGEPPRAHAATVRLLGEDEVEAVVALHELAVAALPPGMVRHDGAEFFHGVLARGGSILGVEAAGRLVAYAVLSLVPEAQREYGRLLGLDPAEWPGVACLDGVAVHPHWRGNGLQHRLAGWRMAMARAAGRRHVCATAAPANHVSWSALLERGMRMRAAGPFYGGLDRYLLHVDHGADPAPPPDPAASVCVAAADFASAARLLADGYVGWRRWMPDPRRVYLVMGRGG